MMTPHLALQPTPGDSMDEGGNEFDPSLDERDRDLDVAYLSRLKDEHKAAKCELDEAQLQLQRGHHRFANSSHAMNTLRELAKVLEYQQHLLSNFAILTLPYEHDGDDDPAYTALKTGRTLRNGLSNMNATAISQLGSHLDRVTSCVDAVNTELPALAERERGSRQLEAVTDQLYRGHLSLMHQSEQLEHRCGSSLGDVVNLPLPSDGRDFDQDITIQRSPQVPVEDVCFPPATLPKRIQTMTKNLPTESALLPTTDSGRSQNSEHGVTHHGDIPGFSHHTPCAQDHGSVSSEHLMLESSDDVRALGREEASNDDRQGASHPVRPGPRRPYLPLQNDTVDAIHTALEQIPRALPVDAIFLEAHIAELRRATPAIVSDALHVAMRKHLQRPDDFIALVIALGVPDFFSKRTALINREDIKHVVLIAVLITAMRVARMLSNDVVVQVATEAALRLDRKGLDDFWKLYPNMALATAVAFARAHSNHLTPKSLAAVMPCTTVNRAFPPRPRRSSVRDAPHTLDPNAEHRDDITPFLAWPVPMPCEVCDDKGRTGYFQLRVCYAAELQNGKNCAACVAQHNSLCPDPPGTDSETTWRNNLKRPNDGQMGEEHMDKRRRTFTQTERQ